jgi:hypothetical protein
MLFSRTSVLAKCGGVVVDVVVKVTSELIAMMNLILARRHGNAKPY